MKMRTLGQIRSEKALEAVQNFIKTTADAKKQDEFKKLAVGFPTMVLKNGFGQALSFCLAKGMKDGREKPNDKHITLFKVIVNWLNHAEGEIKPKLAKSTDPAGFMHEISTMEQKIYHMIQQESLRYMEWVKRYADAFCQEPKNETGK